MVSFVTAPANESSPRECDNGDVRLVGATVPNEGRVELCFHEHWGTVCSDTWDDADAAVVCREMGFMAAGESLFSAVYMVELVFKPSIAHDLLLFLYSVWK